MPYIDKASRERLMARPQEIMNVGELNYQITIVLNDYLHRNGEALTYQKINDCLGAIEGAKLEFYRMVAVPYENMKITQNGLVY